MDLIKLDGFLLKREAAGKILELNDVSSQYGLELSPAQAMELAETRERALYDSGRVEIGSGAVKKIIEGFCSSEYIDGSNYAETINELTEIFYYFKTESLDKISDDELIAFMVEAFNGDCRGSTELLAGRELEKLSRRLRYSDFEDESEDDEDEDESEERAIAYLDSGESVDDTDASEALGLPSRGKYRRRGTSRSGKKKK